MVCVFRNSLVKTFLQSYEIQSIAIILNLTSIIIYSPHQYALHEHHDPVTIVWLEVIHNNIEVSVYPTEYLRKYNKLNNCYNECRPLTTSVIG